MPEILVLIASDWVESIALSRFEHSDERYVKNFNVSDLGVKIKNALGRRMLNTKELFWNRKIMSFFSLMFLMNFTMADNSIPSLENNPSFEKIKDGATFLCDGTKTVGFDWINGRWEFKSFKSNKWILKKISKTSKFCSLKNSTDDYYDINGLKISNLSRCYGIKEFGEKSDVENFINVNVCNETYRSDYPEGVGIQCANHIFYKFAFSPNGPFLLQTSSPFLPPKNANPDSRFMQTGTCSSM